MYKTRAYDIDITVELEPGVYLMDVQSGTGKTYLYKLIAKLAAAGENVAAVRYEGGPNKAVHVSGDLSGDPDLIVVDRGDMYPVGCKEFRQALENKRAIVLVDLKGTRGDTGDMDKSTASVELSADGIRVW